MKMNISETDVRTVKIRFYTKIHLYNLYIYWLSTNYCNGPACLRGKERFSPLESMGEIFYFPIKQARLMVNS